jgi:hypothetical protein
MQVYNKTKIDELLRSRHIPRKVLKEHVSRVKNDVILKELADGSERIGVDQLLSIANFLGVSVTDFFLDDGQPLQGKPAVARSHADDSPVVRQVVESERTLYEERARHQEAMHQLTLQYQKELSAVREEFLLKEADLRVKLASAEAKLEVQTREFNLHSKVYHGYNESDGYRARVAEEE